jgi:hypothetical protein
MRVEKRKSITILETLEEVLAYVNVNPQILFNIHSIELYESAFNDEDNDILDLLEIGNAEIDIDDSGEEETEKWLNKTLIKFPKLELVFVYDNFDIIRCVIHKENKIIQDFIVVPTYRSRPGVAI